MHNCPRDENQGRGPACPDHPQEYSWGESIFYLAVIAGTVLAYWIVGPH